MICAFVSEININLINASDSDETNLSHKRTYISIVKKNLMDF